MSNENPENQPPTPDDQQVEAQQFIQYLHARCPRIRVTPTIVGTNLIVFVVLLALGAGFMGENIEVYIKHGANLGAITKDGEWWRLFTALFMHYGIMHLLFNMWALWDAGGLTERLYGHASFVVIYLFSGLFASLASLYWNADNVASAGASGAVFGVFGALFAYLTIQRNTVPKTLLKQLMNSALFFMGFSLFIGFTKSGIDNAAHIGGLVSGFILGVLLARPITAPRPVATSIATTLIISSVLILSAIQFAPAALYDYHDQKAADASFREFVDKDTRLMEDWQHLTLQLQQGKDLREADSMQALNTIQDDWLALEEKITGYGKVVEQTAKRNDILGEYAHHRAQNARYLIRYLETSDPFYAEQLKNNNDQINGVMERLNSLKN